MDYTINQRIRDVLYKLYNGNISKMAAALDIKRTSLQSVTGPQNSAPGYELIRKIAVNTSPSISLEWLVTGQGSMIKDEEKPATAVQTSNVPMVPLLSLDARGGIADNLEQGEEYVSELIPWDGALRGDFAMVVSGTSMMPIINPGTYVLLRRIVDWQSFLEPNALYVLELRDFRRVLKVVSPSDPDTLTLHSYNPANPDVTVPRPFVRSVFKVIAYLTRLGF